MNLLNMLKDQVSGSLVGQASKFLGESDSGVTKALDGIFPSLLNSTIESAKDEKGAGKLLDMLKGMDTGGMDDIASIFGGGASGVSKLMNQGSGIMNMLMGNKSGGFIDSIAKFAGLGGSSTSSLIKMAAPFLMNMIGKQVASKGLGASGLMDLLKGQKAHVSAAMPSGFAFGAMDKAADITSSAKGKVAAGAAGVAGAAAATAGAGKKMVSGTADKVSGAAGATANAGKKVVSGAANVAGNAVDTTAKAGGSILKWILPLFLLLAIGSFFGLKTCSPVDNMVDGAKDMGGAAIEGAKDMGGAAVEGAKDMGGAIGDAAGKAGDVAGKAAGAVGDAAGAMGDALGGAFGNVNEAAKAALGKIKFATGSAGSQMMKYIDGGFKGDGNFTFKNLTFASGSANMNGQTAAEIDNVAAILNAYPDVKVIVNGYTDNQGNADGNMKLSQARADAVKARLMGKNKIELNRISTKGHGAANPVADNGTPEGRAKNRRIEMQIVK